MRRVKGSMIASPGTRERPVAQDGKAVARLREAIHVSQTELAKQAGVSRMTLARIESGERPASGQEWKAVLQALDTLNRRRQREFVELMREAGRPVPYERWGIE